MIANPKSQLVSVLTQVRELLLRSRNEGWPDECPKEAAGVVGGMIMHLESPENNPLPEFASIYFSPTGVIQEIAMANSWSSEYLALSSDFDSLRYLII